MFLTQFPVGRYNSLSSVEAYKNKKIDLREEDFDPKTNPMKLVDTTAGYVVGKRQAEGVLYQKYNHIKWCYS